LPRPGSGHVRNRSPGFPEQMHLLHHLRAILPRKRPLHRKNQSPLPGGRLGRLPLAKTYDVIVIGAGPSGSLCARDLAAKGNQVLLLEKRPVVGVPVGCGEATGRRARLSRFMDVNEDYIETDLNGVILNGPGGVSIRYDKPDVGLMIDRALFDQDVARQAQRAGAELCVSTRVEGVSPVKDGLREISIVNEVTRAASTIAARVVVGADGAESLSGRWVGLKTRQLPPQTCSAIELRVDAVDANPNHLTFWQGHESV